MNRRQFFTQSVAASLLLRASSDIQLEAAPAANRLAFNQQIPGPVLEARPGDTLRIQFHNALDEPSNLHFHGLHVPPTGIADNSFLEVPPNETQAYELILPANHPSGLFWYHPHMHGMVANQVSSGLAGAILIRGDFDAQPEIQQTPEFLLIFQDPNTNPTQSQINQGREGPEILINGVPNPQFPLTANGWIRLRLLNASVSRFYRLHLEQHTFQIVATDGGLLPSPVETAEILLLPGQRIDAFVKGDRPPATYRLLNLPYNRLGGMQTPNPTTQLATFDYTNSVDSTWSLPAKLTTLDPLPAPSITRQFRFGAMGMGMGNAFTINGRSFDPNRIDTVVKRNAIEDWILTNQSMMDHPFHIHTNPFQIVNASPAWYDVALIPAGRSLRIRHQFTDYTGTAMYHCHILDHEDLGMMATLQITE